MKMWLKMMMMAVLVACVAAMPLQSVCADSAIDLLPTDDAGYTVVEGDGTVTLDGDTMTIVNNTDGDLRIWINYATPFDMTVYNAVHMQFAADMPFKMAFHLISDADASDDWLTTSTDYLDVFELDTSTDRSPAGDYDVTMNIGDLAVNITDKSSVHFDQYILLMTGQGTVTVSAVELVETAPLTSNEDEEEDVETFPTDKDSEPDAEEAIKNSMNGQADDTETIGAMDEEAAFPAVPLAVGAVVLVAAAVTVVVIVKKRNTK